MLLTKEVEISLSGKVVCHYIEKGYNISLSWSDIYKKYYIPKGTKIIVKVEDLTIGSKVLIEYQCDYCKEVFPIRYCDYIKRRKSVVNKDSCKKCTDNKIKESNLIIYGVERTLSLQETRNKIQETNLFKYGYTNPFNSKEVQDNIKIQWKENYGVSNPSQVKEINEKRKETFVERFGFDNPSKDNEVKMKKERTCLKNHGVSNGFLTKKCKEKLKEVSNAKYGVDNVFNHPDFKKLFFKSVVFTKYNKGNAPYSYTQKYLSELLNGKLNYPLNFIWLDIAFPEEMIYCEYDGSGHKLNIKLGVMSEHEFKEKEKKRYYMLKNKNWKMIRIISLKDNLPLNDKILEMFSYAKEYLNSGHSWIKFDIDNNKIINSQGEFNCDYGDLRKIKKRRYMYK